jgi:hypothetical protein
VGHPRHGFDIDGGTHDDTPNVAGPGPLHIRPQTHAHLKKTAVTAKPPCRTVMLLIGEDLEFRQHD